MKAKVFFLVLLTAVLAGAAGYLIAQRKAAHPSARGAVAENGTRKIKFYQSPMHPWIKSEKPGKCTICGMDLVPVYEGDQGFAASGDLVTLTPATAAVVGVHTSEVTRGPLARTLRVTGTIDDDDTRHRIISAYTEVRLEKLFVNYVGQTFEQGQPLALVYSPELLQARQEFHTLVKTTPDSPLTRAARERLRRLGLLDQQLDELARTSEVARETEILAPMGGAVLERNAYEGSYVMAGSPILTIADFSKMWFLFDAYETDLPWIKEGVEVAVSVPSLPKEKLTAPIAFINPNLDEMTRTTKVRVILDNADRKLLHRQTAYGAIQLEKPDVLLVPRNAVLFTRGEPIVFIDKTGSAYEPRKVKLGQAGDHAYELLDGLKEGDRVVTEGALLLDSQAQLAHSAGGHQHGEAAKATPAADHNASHNAPDGLKALVLLAADAAAALAADDLEAYRKVLPKLTSSVHAVGSAHDTLAPLAAKLTDSPDIKAARRAFEPFSTALADFARDAHFHHSGVVKIYQCPMSPVLGTGRWVQRSGDLRNPFFGSAMLECGEEIK